MPPPPPPVATLRRVVIKAEVVRLDDREPRDNPRFVVTNLRHVPPFRLREGVLSCGS